MRMKSRALILTALAVLAGCGGNQQNNSTQGGTNFTSQPASPRPLNASAEYLTKGSGVKSIEAGNALGLKLLQAVSVSEGNVLISPLSLASSLGLAYNGAGGETRLAIAKALQLDKIKAQDLNQAAKAIREELAVRGEKVDLKIANSLWLKDGTEFKSDFLKANRSSFSGHTGTAKLGDKTGIAAINKWISDNTSGEIKNAVTEPLDTPLMAVNGAFFRGTWKTAFDAAATRGDKFTPAKGEPVNVPMMSRAGTHLRFKSEGFEAVRLPYADGRTSLIVILPTSDVAAFLKDFGADKWVAIFDGFKEETGLLSLPKFKAGYENELSDELTGLGMGGAFGPEANFSAISAGKVSLGRMVHKTLIEIGEEGAEQPAKPGEAIEGFNFVANRPFIYAVVDDNTKAILLIGIFNKPE